MMITGCLLFASAYQLHLAFLQLKRVKNSFFVEQDETKIQRGSTTMGV